MKDTKKTVPQGMNKKAEAFDAFLIREDMQCFEKRIMEDEESTVIYRSYIQTEGGDVPVFVLLDKTIYAIVRLPIGNGLVTPTNRAAVETLLNSVNSMYKSFKLYVEDVDNTVYLDCVYMSADSAFEPELLYVLMKQIIEYMQEHIKDYLVAYGMERLPDVFQVNMEARDAKTDSH